MLHRILAAGVLSLGIAWAQNAPVEPLAYSLDKQAFEGRFVLPSAAKGAKASRPLPAVVLFPDWMGVTPRAVEDAQRIAAWGYAVLVADPYGKDKQPKNPAEAGKLAGGLKADAPLLRRRAAAALETLKRHPGVDSARVAALGFCFGGSAALELARSGAALEGVISIHGNLKTSFPEDARNIRGPVLVLHGADDPVVPQEEVRAFQEEMRKGGADWQVVQYGGAVHAFTNPQAGANPKSPVAYNAKAAERAYAALRAFLGETLGDKKD